MYAKKINKMQFLSWIINQNDKTFDFEKKTMSVKCRENVVVE